jgi:hypothetical protein
MSTTTTTAAVPDSEPLLDVREAAALLRVPISWLYGESRKGEKGAVPAIRIGRYLRYRKVDLQEWILHQRVGGGQHA